MHKNEKYAFAIGGVLWVIGLIYFFNEIITK